MFENNYVELTLREIFRVLDKATHCRLGVAENNQPYIVPMYYSWKRDKGNIIFILRSPETGEKMNCMHANSKISLEFEVYNYDKSMSTVVVRGDVISFTEVNDAVHKECYVKITIETNEISGRRYFCF